MKLHTLVAAVALMPAAALAHNLWLLPSKTVLSNGQWITVDAGASTQPFVKDHAPLRLDSLVITAPDGSHPSPENAATGKLRSTFDLQLTQDGTYRIAVVNSGLSAAWEDSGERRFWPPRGQPFTAEGFAREVPKGAKNLRVMQRMSRLETFVTAGKPGGRALEPIGQGLEVAPVTPFNDLFADEPATFQLLLDGKPAANQKVELIADGIRYRSAVDEIELTTNADGRFTIEWPAPGLYWLTTSLRDDKATAPATERNTSYTATFEVLSP